MVTNVSHKKVAKVESSLEEVNCTVLRVEYYLNALIL